MSTGDGSILEVEVGCQIHPGLSVEVRLTLGREIGVVFGPSGAGKTTLLGLIAGLRRPERGKIVLDGECLFDASRRLHKPLRERRIGMIHQADRLFPHLRVFDNVRFGLRGWGSGEAKARVSEVGALCGIEGLMDRWPATLSGGEGQRVGLARALAPRPRLLMCDEPVSALDIANRHVMVERLRLVQRSERIPVLYVTHSPSEAIALGSTLFYLKDGRITAQGRPMDIVELMLGGGGVTAGGSEFANVFRARIDSDEPERVATRIRLDDGPELIIPFLDRRLGDEVLVSVRGDDILLARQRIVGLSARNQIEGTVERIIRHGPEAEVIVRTDGLCWIVSVVAAAVDQLELARGSTVLMIVKARSCHVVSGVASAR